MKKAIFGLAAVAILAIPVFAMAPTSGLKVGDMTSAFEPTHIAGPDKGTETCPVCKYGNRPAVQVWHKGDSSENVVAMINHLDGKVAESKHELKAFTIGLTDADHSADVYTKIAASVKGKNVGITELPVSSQAIEDYKINTAAEVKNTVIVYKNRKVVATFVNLKADEAGLKQLDAALAKVDK